ncbi:transposase [Verrucomicrobiota bacterium]
MRRAREKPGDTDCYYHVYNRVVGMPGDRPFKAREKARFLRFVKKLTKYYVIEVTSLVAMGSHVHLTLYVPTEVPSTKVTCQRYHDYYQGRKELDPDSADCERIALMLRDLSCFMHDLQQQFSVWYNKTRVKGQVRRGSLWAGRFKSKLLRSASAIWHCLVYHIMNPVRSELVENPARYRYSCWGLWNLFGRHPFGESVERRVVPRLSGMLDVKTLEHLRLRIAEQLEIELRAERVLR